MKGEEIAFYIARAAQKAVLYEVSTTPKPGLVDRWDNGAHRDMDFFTFMNSSAVIYKGFFKCALEGLSFDGSDSIKLLDSIRIYGLECEREMFMSTKGVNTHKGIIFSLGLLSAAAGRLLSEKLKLSGTASAEQGFTIAMEDICMEVSHMSRGLVLKDFKNLDNKKELTNGERLYRRLGITGIRGEAESGFSTVEKNVFSLLRRWNIERDLGLNQLFIQVLLTLMADNEDTNILTRSGEEGLDFVKASAKAFLAQGGVRNPEYLGELNSLNDIFIKKNISPGGSADLLAVSIFLAIMEGIIN